MFPWTLFLLSLSFVLSYSILFSVLFTLGLCCYHIPLCILFLIVILFECWKNCKTQSIPTHFKKRQGKGWICQKNLKTQSILSYFENKAGQGPILSKESYNSIYSNQFQKKVGHRPISSKESKDSIYSIPTFSHSRDVPQTDGSKQCKSFYLYPWKIKLLCSLDIKCLSPLPVGVSMCLFRDTARPQDSLHCAHLCTFFPVWIIMCVLRWPAWLNDLFPIIASRYLFRLNDIGWRTGKGINVTSYAESPGILSQMFYHKFRIWTQ